MKYVQVNDREYFDKLNKLLEPCTYTVKKLMLDQRCNLHSLICCKRLNDIYWKLMVNEV